MKYTIEEKEEIFNNVCDLIEGGKSVREILLNNDMPSRRTFNYWLKKESEKEGESALLHRYARACEERALNMFEDMIEIVNNIELGDTIKIDNDGNVIEITRADMLAHRKLKIDTYKWILSKMQPKKYGDKVTVEGNQNIKIQQITGMIII